MKHKYSSIMRFLLSGLMLTAYSLVLSGQQPPADSSKAGSPDKCHTVAIIGAVRIPGRFEVRRDLTLKELIACAGGLAERAGRAVQIVHGKVPTGCPQSTDASTNLHPHEILELFDLAKVMSGDEKSNPYVEAGNIVVVPELDPVYVTGGVIAPQAIYLKEKLTFTQAIAIAGGVTRDSKTDRIRIIRQTLGSSARTEITVDLKAIRKGRAEDPVLQPFDIIEVPEKQRGQRWPLGPIDPVSSPPLRAVC